MTEVEFKKDIKRVSGPRKHKVKNSLGVYDAYKYIRKNLWFDIERPLKEGEFYSIIRTMNKLIAELLSYGKEVKLPMSLGSLEIRKIPTRLEIVDGKLVTNYPIDWNATLELWYNDEDARKLKILIRLEEKDVFRVYYNKNKANYTNKSFMEFLPNRELKLKVKLHAKEGILDAFILAKHD